MKDYLSFYIYIYIYLITIIVLGLLLIQVSFLMMKSMVDMDQEDGEMGQGEIVEAGSGSDVNMANLAEMNLILVLAYCSLSGEEIEFREPEKCDNSKPPTKNSRSRSMGRKQDTNEFRPRSTRFQHTKIRDCR